MAKPDDERIRTRVSAESLSPDPITTLLDRLRTQTEEAEGVEWIDTSPIFLHGVNPGEELPFRTTDLWRQLVYVSAAPLYQPGTDWKTMIDFLKTGEVVKGVKGAEVSVRCPHQTRHGLHLGVVDIRMKSALRLERLGSQSVSGNMALIQALEAAGVPLISDVNETITDRGVLSIRLFPHEGMAQEAIGIDLSSGADAFGSFVPSRVVGSSVG